MDTIIDLDEIVMLGAPRLRTFSGAVRDELRRVMKESICQALVLASEKATLRGYRLEQQGQRYDDRNIGQEINVGGVPSYYVSIDKQSILEIELLIK